MTKLIYKVDNKYVKDGKVKLVFERGKTNLLISKYGLHYMELNGKCFSCTQKQPENNMVTKSVTLNKDYYDSILELSTPVINMISTEKMNADIEKRFKNATPAQYLVYRPILPNYKIFISGVCINEDEPIFGKATDVVATTKSIKHLRFSEYKIDLKDEERINNIFKHLFPVCDEQYIISREHGIISINIGISEKANANTDITKYISKYMNKCLNDVNHVLYFVTINRGSDMNLVSLCFNGEVLNLCQYDINDIFLSKDDMLLNIGTGIGDTVIQRGKFDLLTFEDNTDDYKRMVKRSHLKKI